MKLKLENRQGAISHKILPFIFLFSLSPFLFLLDAQDTDSSRVIGKIQSVTIFSDRALVKRNQEIKLQGDETTLRFARLPATVVLDSIRASSDGALNISSVSIRTISSGEDSELTNDPLKKKMISIQQEIRSETDRQTNFREQLKLLSSLGQLTTEESDRQLRTNSVDVKNWSASLEFLETRRNGYLEKIQKSEERLEQLNKEFAQTNASFLRMADAKRWSHSEVEVVCSGKAGSKGIVSIEYLVTNVSWRGIYDLHGSSEGGDFRLESRVAVRQYTGEDWKNVDITISSAKPSSAIFLPPLKPWRVSQGSLTQPSRNVNSEEASPSDSEVSEGEDVANFTFRLPNKETIVSDNSEHRVTMDSAQIKGSISHVAIPTLSNFVFLKAKFKNTTKMPLLWNDVKVFMDGSFIGSYTPGNRTAMGQEFEMYLGPDQRMKLKRSLLKGEVAGAGFLGKTVQIENQWQIEVSNFTKRPRQVTIYDQFPVTADPNISTKFLGSSNDSFKKDANGTLSWTLLVKPGEKEKLDFSYSIEIPQTMWTSLENIRDDRNKANEIDDLKQQNAPASPKKIYNLERIFK
ncbi:mucoidy inhibitor MuiA family protein [Leptospira sp. 201903070]|uniref:Mucoidy inhibitor MuiA family protein n=1 Tax=Leptospira ainlahdjerensis TaxID=2810033 RepID=A0ABS2UCN4_9LEPT|nr:mucoidy inhibitor MuiA family protein [Leptospira ainlahdjerensis]MBM9578121.1 mucoidy inhibitor MuiA family protein [Leptospira ainlahdjerensis]